MQTLVSYIHRHQSKLPWLFCFLIAAAYMLPMLLFPGFTVIDDGWNLQIAHTLSLTPLSGWSAILVETALGRLRPLHYLYFYVLYLMAGPHPLIFWVGQWLVVVGTALLMYQLLIRFTKNVWLSMLGIVVPFIFTAIPENLYRLGTQEPRQFLFELGFILWAIKLEKKTLTWVNAGIGVLLLLLALGTKETSLVLIPLFLSIYVLRLIQGNWRSWSFLALTICVTLLGVIFYKLIPPATSYSLGYQSSMSDIILHAYQIRLEHISFLWLMGVATCFAIVRLYFFSPSLKLKKILTDNFGQLVIFIAILGSIAILLPWGMQLVRYYYNVTLLILMFVTIEVAAWLTLIKPVQKLSWLQRVIVFGTVIVLAGGMTRIVFQKLLPDYSHMVQDTAGSMEGWFSGYQNNYVLIKYLMANTTEGGSFYAAYADYEVVYDMGQYASLFGDRHITIYNANQLMSHDFGYPYVYIADPYTAYKADPKQKVLVDKATEPKLSTLGTPIENMMPKVTYFKAPKDLWAVTKSP